MAETTPRRPDESHAPPKPDSGTVAANTDSPPLLNTPPAPHGPPTRASVPDLVGRFRIGDELARGGMGVVYRAHEPSAGRDVAVKVLQDEFRGDDRMTARFVAESRITAQLQHPGIPPVFEIGELSDGSPFLAMKLIQGHTLADSLRARVSPAAEPDFFVGVFEQVCQAIAYAHANGVIHRDLKPANVMVGAHGEVQVMDWGLAKLADRGQGTGDSEDPATRGVALDPAARDVTAAGAVLGTPAYMAPEQARGETDEVDRRSDVFGLGAILCAILTGHPPYAAPDGESARQMAAAAELGTAVARLDACKGEPGLVELCKRCLSPAKADRPGDGGAVAKAVARLRAEAEERARQMQVNLAGAVVRDFERRKRLRVQLALAAAVLVIAAGGAGFAWWNDWQESARLLEEEQRKGAEFRAETEAENARASVRNLLAAAQGLRERYQFDDAKVALDQAERLTAEGAADLRPAVEAARADFDFVRLLDDIRMRRSTWVPEPGGRGHFDTAAAPEDYPKAFRGRGLDVLDGDPAAVAAAVAASPVRVELVAALDDWAALPLAPDAAARILGVLRRADPGPWLDAFRDPAVRADPMRLWWLARRADPAALHPAALTALAGVMAGRGLDPTRLLARAQLAHPDEFLIPFQLAHWHNDREEHDAAIAQYRVARVTRPGNLAVLTNLGNALADKGNLDEAAQTFREAIRLAPDYARAHFNLGVALKEKGDLDGAVAAYREAARLDPKDAKAPGNLGGALARKGDLDGAVAAYRETVRRDPKDARAYSNLAIILGQKRDLAGAAAAYRETVRLDPKLTLGHYGLGVTLGAMGDLDGAVAALQEARRLDPKDPRTIKYLNIALKLKAERDAKTAPPPRPVDR